MSQETQQAAHDRLCNCGEKVLPEKQNEQEWFRPQDKLPPENVVVDTLNSHGQMTRLKIMRGLWWFADGSMYIYYVPTFWRLTSQKSGSGD